MGPARALAIGALAACIGPGPLQKKGPSTDFRLGLLTGTLWLHRNLLKPGRPRGRAHIVGEVMADADERPGPTCSSCGAREGAGTASRKRRGGPAFGSSPRRDRPDTTVSVYTRSLLTLATIASCQHSLTNLTAKPRYVLVHLRRCSDHPCPVPGTGGACRWSPGPGPGHRPEEIQRPAVRATARSVQHIRGKCQALHIHVFPSRTTSLIGVPCLPN